MNAFYYQQLQSPTINSTLQANINSTKETVFLDQWTYSTSSGVISSQRDNDVVINIASRFEQCHGLSFPPPFLTPRKLYERVARVE